MREPLSVFRYKLSVIGFDVAILAEASNFLLWDSFGGIIVQITNNQ
jgi:hypothetical protein